MGEQRRPRLRGRKTDSSVSRSRSTSPSLFFKSSSSSNLLRLKQARSPLRESRSISTTRATIDNAVAETEGNSEEFGNSKDSSNNLMIDVLPSFELYNALHRHIPRGNVNADHHDFPPTYQEVQTRNPSHTSLSTTSIPMDGTPTDGSSSSENLRSLSRDPYLNLESFSTVQEPIEDDLNDTDNIFIDKLYSLPKATMPIEIDIHVTKQVADPDRAMEEESILKEYTSGDIINGYVIIENKSSRPLKFEMFYVSLEGYTSVIDKDYGKRTVKRFLRMVDISASWSYSKIDVSSGINYTPGRLDYDNCYIGLNNNRTLEVGTKYKKFFMFKLPTQLLDISCKHEQFSHCLVPPSFGIDKNKSNGKYSGIKVNPMLGYGHLGTKGCPILTNDLSTDDVSINYTIDAKIVGKDVKTQKLNIMREKEYNLRFIPFGFCQPLLGERPPLKQIYSLTKLIQERIDSLTKVLNRLKKNENITVADISNTDISGSIVNVNEVDSSELLRLKLNQLYIDNRLDPACSSFPLKNGKLSSHKNLVEAEFSYSLKTKSKSSTKLKKGIFSGFASNGSSTSSSTQPKSSFKSGIIVLSAELPKEGLPYIEPSLLKKTNALEKQSKHNQDNWQSMIDSLTDDDLNILSKLNVRLRCIQAANSEPHSPPEINSLTTELICITAKSINSIPVKLNAELLLNEDKVSTVRSTFQQFRDQTRDLQKEFEENCAELNLLFNRSGGAETHQELRFTDFLSKQLITDIESMASLRVDIQPLQHVFKKQIHTLTFDDDSVSASMSKSNSTGSILSAPFSASSSNGNLHGATSEKMKEQLTREWIQSSESEYDRVITVNLCFNPNIKETLIPTFESCLLCRMYCVRVNIKFDGQVGTACIDIPVRIRKLEA
ncbi:LAFE_0G07404g1_1 [Lachancea fermentati]|uniref:LAFE_0G07404g1_1 n=1 Tax=Lachancea fermentati TaxID=4955 RepID=A0A1G4MHT7_LACFM|nr:LAFE_0G07404g1_1 [Lachancea fermentati]